MDSWWRTEITSTWEFDGSARVRKSGCFVLSVALFAFITVPGFGHAIAADFTPLSADETFSLIHGVQRFEDSKPHWPMKDYPLPLGVAVSIPRPRADCVNSAAAGCSTGVAYVTTGNAFLREFSFRTKAGFDWKVERIEDFPLGVSPLSKDFEDTPPKTAVECVLITLSEALHDGGRDPATGAWPRRTHKTCIDGQGRLHEAAFDADILPMTALDHVIASQTPIAFQDVFSAGYKDGHGVTVPNTTPWRIGILKSDPASNECGYRSIVATCESFMVVAISDGAKQFAFRGPDGFSWQTVDLKTVVRADSSPLCAYLMFVGQVRDPKSEEAFDALHPGATQEEINARARQHLPPLPAPPRFQWPMHKVSVCASPDGIVDVK